MEKQNIIILFVSLILIAVIVSILFPFSRPIEIQTNVSCDHSPSLNVKNNLEKGLEQTKICEEKCLEIDVDSSSSTCRDRLLICFCHS